MDKSVYNVLPTILTTYIPTRKQHTIPPTYPILNNRTKGRTYYLLGCLDNSMWQNVATYYNIFSKTPEFGELSLTLNPS